MSEGTSVLSQLRTSAEGAASGAESLCRRRCSVSAAVSEASGAEAFGAAGGEEVGSSVGLLGLPRLLLLLKTGAAAFAFTLRSCHSTGVFAPVPYTLK